MTLAKKIIESIKKINEMSPVRMHGKLDTNNSKFRFISDESLKNDFILLTNPYDNDNNIKVFIRRSRSSAIVVIKSRPDEVRSNKILSILTFKEKSEIPKTLQVDLVEVDPAFKSMGTSTLLYLTLAYNNYIIVSDYRQYEDGIKLWKSISDNPKDFNIKIYDTKSHTYIKDNEGKDLIYHPDTIPDHDVWSDDPSRDKILTLLVLTRKV